jgi:fluoride exporter
MYASLIVFLGAGVGGVLRHGVNQLALRFLGVQLPYGTAIVNVVGSFLMGLFVSYFALRGELSQHWRLFLTTGVLGGFTTFSAFSLDVAMFYERGGISLAALYAVGSVVISVAALFLGMWVLRDSPFFMLPPS